MWWLQPLVTVVVGGAAVWIAIQQWLVNQNKLRIDLYPKRYELYARARRYIGVAIKGAPERSVFNDFKDVVAQSRFLFDMELTKYLREIRDKGREMRRLQDELAKNPAHQQELIQAINQLSDYHATLLKGELENRFARYLDLTDLGVKRTEE